MRIANMLGLGLAMPLYGGLSVYLSGGVGLVCADSFSEHSLIQAGRDVQRIWCTLDHLGYALQPLAAIPLLTIRQRIEGDTAFSPQHVRLLNRAWAITKKVLAVPPEYVPVFMFRTGLSRPISQRTFQTLRGRSAVQSGLTLKVSSLGIVARSGSQALFADVSTPRYNYDKRTT